MSTARLGSTPRPLSSSITQSSLCRASQLPRTAQRRDCPFVSKRKASPWRRIARAITTYVGNKVAQASANCLSRDPFQWC